MMEMTGISLSMAFYRFSSRDRPPSIARRTYGSLYKRLTDVRLGMLYERLIPEGRLP